MLCPKCGYISFDHLISCLKCKKDLSAVSAELAGTAFQTEQEFFLGAVVKDFDSGTSGESSGDLKEHESLPDAEIENEAEVSADGENLEIDLSAEAEAEDVLDIPEIDLSSGADSDEMDIPELNISGDEFSEGGDIELSLDDFDEPEKDEEIELNIDEPDIEEPQQKEEIELKIADIEDLSDNDDELEADSGPEREVSAADDAGGIEMPSMEVEQEEDAELPASPEAEASAPAIEEKSEISLEGLVIDKEALGLGRAGKKDQPKAPKSNEPVESDGLSMDLNQIDLSDLVDDEDTNETENEKLTSLEQEENEGVELSFELEDSEGSSKESGESGDIMDLDLSGNHSDEDDLTLESIDSLGDDDILDLSFDSDSAPEDKDKKNSQQIEDIIDINFDED